MNNCKQNQERETDQYAMRLVNKRLKSHIQKQQNFTQGLPMTEALAEMFRRLERLPTRHELNRAYLCEAMRRAGANQKRAAIQIGITPQALCCRLKKYPDLCKKSWTIT